MIYCMNDKLVRQDGWRATQGRTGMWESESVRVRERETHREREREIERERRESRRERTIEEGWGACAAAESGERVSSLS